MNRSWHQQQSFLGLATLGPSAARFVVDQVVGQTSSQLLEQAATVLEHLHVDHLLLVQAVLQVLASAHPLAENLTATPVDVLVTLLLPVGGPVWAGIVPVRSVVAGLRWARSSARIPASRYALPAGTRDPGDMSTRTLIVDDSDGFLDVAGRLLRRDGLDVVGTASTSDEALDQLTALRPEVVLVDVNLGSDSGFDLARRIACAGSVAAPVILMSTHSESEYADLLATASVVGFLPKERLSGDAVRALLEQRTA